MASRRSSIPWFQLLLLTGVALCIHGYHLGCDDAAIYLPAVKKIIDPALYPFGSEFFLSHGRFSRFAAIVGITARASGLNGDFVIFLWYVGTVFATLLATWQFAATCFRSVEARWSALLLITTLLTIPIAGTALALMDPYLTARSAATPLILFAITAFLLGKRGFAALWMVLAALVHPMMTAYGVALIGILTLSSKRSKPDVPQQKNKRYDPVSSETSFALRSLALPIGLHFTPVSPAYSHVIEMRKFLFLTRWTWYEIFGVIAPVVILLWIGRVAPRGASRACVRVSNAAAILGLLATAVAVIFCSSHAFDNFVRLQPMRAFHLIYLIFFVLLGGLLGEYLLKSRRWLWIGLFTVVGAGMFLVQLISFPGSQHIELPMVAPRNPWVAAFLWVRHNTPTDAVFALDPNYIELPGEDRHGFRAIAERSVLTDYVKDSGVVSLFPQLAEEWQREQVAQRDWTSFGLADFQHLAELYPVSWIVWRGSAPDGLECPYRNAAVTVCRIPGARGFQGSISELRSTHLR